MRGIPRCLHCVTASHPITLDIILTMDKRFRHFLINFQLFWAFTEAKGNCDTRFCQTYSFDVYGDAMQDKELVGHVFHNSVTSSPVQCYLWCIYDCRCLSFKYKEKKDTRYYELNKGSHFTQISSLVHSPGSRH